MNHHQQIDLAQDEPRCLGKTPEGKPNGCAMAYQCQRHLAIYSDPIALDIRVAGRICQPTIFNAYLPVDRIGVDSEGGEA